MNKCCSKWKNATPKKEPNLEEKECRCKPCEVCIICEHQTKKQWYKCSALDVKLCKYLKKCYISE